MQLLDLIIIYHSRTNGTEQMATAAFDAAKLHSQNVKIYNAEKIDFSDDFKSVLNYHYVILIMGIFLYAK